MKKKRKKEKTGIYNGDFWRIYKTNLTKDCDEKTEEKKRTEK